MVCVTDKRIRLSSLTLANIMSEIIAKKSGHMIIVLTLRLLMSHNGDI